MMKGNKTWMVIVLTALLVTGLFWVCSAWSSAKAGEGKVTSQEVISQDILAMLEAHPYKQTVEEYMDELVTAIHETSKCSKACVICADACLGEKDTMLTACIRMNNDCADICCVTSNLLSRLTETPMNVVRSQLQTCILACQECSAECNKHVDQYEHCRICTDICSQCAQACNDLLTAMQ
jgi:hypothetical protein